jgi:hypothetical protein
MMTLFFYFVLGLYHVSWFFLLPARGGFIEKASSASYPRRNVTMTFFLWAHSTTMLEIK